MNAVGNLPIETAAPSTANAPATPTKADAGKQSLDGKFDSVLADKQKTPASADDQSTIQTQADATQVSGKQNSDAKGGQHGDKQNDEAKSNLALAYLLATLPGQKLPAEKSAVTPNAEVTSGDASAGQSAASEKIPATGTELENGALKLLRLANAVPATVVAETKILPGEDPVKQTQATVPLVQASTVAPLPTAVENTATPHPPAAVPQPGGMSIALQHATMQNAQKQQANSEALTTTASATVPGAEPQKHFAATTSDSNSNGNSDSQKSFDSQQILAGTATLSDSAKLISQSATSASFSSAIEKTQNMQNVINHVIEGAGQMRSDGHTNVELQVPLRDGQNLTIQLHWSNGELQPVFKTESTELRNAIQQNWSQFTSSAGERGMKITTPVFQSPQSGMGDLNQRQNREQQQQTGAWQSENFSLPSQFNTGVPSRRAEAPAPAAAQAAQGLALYA